MCTLEKDRFVYNSVIGMYKVNCFLSILKKLTEKLIVSFNVFSFLFSISIKVLLLYHFY